MLTQKIGITDTITPIVSITKFRLIGLTGHATAGGFARGVSQQNADAGDPVAVALDGVLIVEAGAAIDAGVDIEVGTNGKAVTKSSGVAVGHSLTAATQDGDLINIQR